MKINFTKVTAVLTSGLMAVSGIGLAAAASWPAPFVASGVANAAVVYGTGTGVSSIDSVQAGNIQADLNDLVTTTISEPTDEFVKFEKSSTKLNLGEGFEDVVTTSITDDSPGDGLPTLLADGIYVDDDNDEFDYTQKIDMANLSVTMWEDNDYAEDEPTVGIRVANGGLILNYTLDFTDQPLWSDLTSTDIEMMGKNYFILSYTNGTKLTLLDSASTTTLSEGETTTINGHNVGIDFIGSSSVKLDVDGEVTNTLSATETQKLSDGSYVGIKEINTQDYAGGVKTVEFSIGSGKLELTSGNDVKMNDNTISGLKTTLNTSGTSSGDKITAIKLQWDADDDSFATESSEITMPGFESVKVTFTGLTMPAEETVTVKGASTTYVELSNFPLKDATINIPILFGDSKNWTGIGKDADNLLATTFNETLWYDSDTMDYFVITWDDGSDAESYLCKSSSFTEVNGGTTTAYNTTTVSCADDDAITGWADKKENAQKADVITIGNGEVTISHIDKEDKTVNITAGSNVNFHTLFTNTGMKFYLPSNLTGSATTECRCNSSFAEYPGCINTSETDTTAYLNQFNLTVEEEDKDGNKYGGNNISILLAWNSASTKEAYVSSVDATEAGTSGDSTEIGNTDVFRDFVYSELATEILWDKSGDQYSVNLVYHGDETTANAYITAPGSTSASTSNVMYVTDAEVSSVSSKNLVVVGGSCINSAAASLVGGSHCGPAWTSATNVGSGQFLIKAYPSSTITSELALLVAGYEAADTQNAATYLRTQTVDTNKEYLGTSSTSAELVVA